MSEIVKLPIGIELEGEVQKEVVINPLDGFGREIIGDKKYRSCSGKRTTALLLHSIESVNGKSFNEASVRSLFTVDRNALLVDLQKCTMGDILESKYSCHWCPEVFSINENLADLKCDTLPDGEYIHEVEVTLPVGYKDKENVLHMDVVLRIPTGVDEEVTSTYLKNNYGEWCNRMIVRTAMKFGSLDMDKFAGLGIKIVQAMHIKDIKACINAITSDLPGYHITRLVTCTSCGKESEQVLDMSGFFD